MRTRSIIISLVLAASSLALVAPAAQADSCTGYAHAYTNDTYSYSTYAGCLTQARIDRYYSGSVHSYYGSWDYSSHAYSASGYNAGNAWRLGGSGWMWL